MNEKGCGYGHVSRSMIENNRIILNEIKTAVNEINNHYSQRLPPWASWVMTFAGIIIGALLGVVFS